MTGCFSFFDGETLNEYDFLISCLTFGVFGSNNTELVARFAFRFGLRLRLTAGSVRWMLDGDDVGITAVELNLLNR